VNDFKQPSSRATHQNGKEEADVPDKPESALDGLSREQKGMIVLSAFGVVVLSLIVASGVMWSALNTTQLNNNDHAAVAALSDAGGTALEKAILRVHAIDAVINTKLIANKQALILVAFAGAFALASVGFALFLLGADGAFKVRAEHGGGGKLLLMGTAPGLLCFLLATVLISLGITHRSQVTLGTVSFPGYGVTEPSRADGLVCSKSDGSDCLTKRDAEALAP